jgi:hypothetical protein
MIKAFVITSGIVSMASIQGVSMTYPRVLGCVIFIILCRWALGIMFGKGQAVDIRGN